MKETIRVGLIVLAVMLAACAAPQTPQMPRDAMTARITVLYDAFGGTAEMRQDWGYAALIEVHGKRVLFDTGNDGDILVQNAKAKGVDLSRLDFVVMSHRHGDHMGGLAMLLRMNPQVVIYAPKDFGGVYGDGLPTAAFRKDESLPPEQRYYAGNTPDVMRLGSAWPRANFRLVDRDTEILTGFHIVTLVSDKPGTMELRELSLAIETSEGVVLVVGCSHPGIDKIVQHTIPINPRIRLLIGGIHLVTAKDEEIERIVTLLHDTFKVEYVAPGHCTGEATFAALERAYGDRDIYAGLGTVVTLEPAPR